jgi:hypothetical protein
MPPRKVLLHPQRLRHIPPEGFSWIDRRLLREGWLELLSQEALLLYLLLVIASDAQGLSFYADPTVVRILKLTHEDLFRARAELEKQRLIGYRCPLYQVFDVPRRQLGPSRDAKRPRKEAQPTLIGEIFKELAARSENP